MLPDTQKCPISYLPGLTSFCPLLAHRRPARRKRERRPLAAVRPTGEGTLRPCEGRTEEEEGLLIPGWWHRAFLLHTHTREKGRGLPERYVPLALFVRLLGRLDGNTVGIKRPFPGGRRWRQMGREKAKKKEKQAWHQSLTLLGGEGAWDREKGEKKNYGYRVSAL